MIQFVTDRSEADVYRAKYLKSLWVYSEGHMVFTGTDDELSEYLVGLKGAYNYTDLNRIGEAVLYLTGKLAECGYDVSVSPKTDWVPGEYPTSEQMNRYLDDVRTLKSVLVLKQGTPDVPDSMADLTYQGANDIEKVLDAVQIAAESVIRVMLHSNQILFYSGFAVYVSQQQFNYVGLYTNDDKAFIDANSAKVYVRSEE